MRATRCPFCHDAIPGAAADLVACAGCGAEHHADCFLESDGCATCRVSTARVGQAEVTLSALADVLAQGRLAGLAREPAPPVRDPVSAAGVALLLTVFGAFVGAPALGGLIWALGFFRRGDNALVVGAVVGGLLGLIAAWRLVRDKPDPIPLRLTLGPQEGFDAILGQWRSDPNAVGVPPDPMRHMLEATGRPEPPPDDPPGDAPSTPPTPAHCPWCEESLEPDGDEQPLACCYHCGGQLLDTPEGRALSTDGPRRPPPERQAER